MHAKIFNWKENIKKEELEEVINCINNHGVIIFPTDTVYGIACNCFDELALKKIFSFKERPESKPINVLTNSISKIETVAQNISNKEKQLIEKYMPGALTIILKKKETVPNLLTASLDTVGVRIPEDKCALKILERLSFPLAATSVNLTGKSPGNELSDFLEEFQDKVDIIIDGGPSKLKLASTIVKVEDNEINVLREGSIKISEVDNI